MSFSAPWQMLATSAAPQTALRPPAEHHRERSADWSPTMTYSGELGTSSRRSPRAESQQYDTVTFVQQGPLQASSFVSV